MRTHVRHHVRRLKNGRFAPVRHHTRTLHHHHAVHHARREDDLQRYEKIAEEKTVLAARKTGEFAKKEWGVFSKWSKKKWEAHKAKKRREQENARRKRMGLAPIGERKQESPKYEKAEENVMG